MRNILDVVVDGRMEYLLLSFTLTTFGVPAAKFNAPSPEYTICTNCGCGRGYLVIILMQWVMISVIKSNVNFKTLHLIWGDGIIGIGTWARTHNVQMQNVHALICISINVVCLFLILDTFVFRCDPKNIMLGWLIK